MKRSLSEHRNKRVAKKEKKLGLTSQIIIGVSILLIGGGSVPWWYPKRFPSKSIASPQPSPVIQRDITGRWVSGTGIYNVTQTGTQVVWDGIGRYGNKVWHHKATGSIEGDTIHAMLEELPDSNYPGVPGGAKTEGTISSDWQTITWTGQNDQERVWHRGG